MKARGQSELIAAVLLTLIVAVLGFFVLYQALRTSYIMKYTLSTGGCDFTIVAAPYNRTGLVAYIRPVIYVSSSKPCKITEILILSENGTRVLNNTKVNIYVSPGSLYILPPVEVKISGNNIVIVRVVSASGAIHDFTLYLE